MPRSAPARRPQSPPYPASPSHRSRHRGLLEQAGQVKGVGQVVWPQGCGGLGRRGLDWGLGLGWQAESGLALKAIWSRRLGNNPNPTSNGNDQDGTFVRNRYWLTAAVPF